jgi:cell shape-determining protein MreC
MSSAACLSLAAWLFVSRPSPTTPAGTAAGELLQRRVLEGAAAVDSALRVLSDRTRDLSDTDELKAQNEMLREELRALVAHLEELLRLAREAQQPAPEDARGN